MARVTQKGKSSQQLTKYFIGGILFPVARHFWPGYEDFFDPSLLRNRFLQKALVAAANEEEETLQLIYDQEKRYFLADGFTHLRANRVS